MRRLITSLSTQDRLRRASDFLTQFGGQEVLLLSTTRTAADEFVRQCSVGTAGVFGVHRFTLPQLAFMLASERLAQQGKSFLVGVAMDAMAARAVQSAREDGPLSWFEAVARTPGFFRALASTIHELRLNNVNRVAVDTIQPAGPDLARLLKGFERNLQESELADLAAAYRTAMDVITEPGFRFAGRPLLLLDVLPASLLEQEMIRSLAIAASDVLATAHTRDTSSIQVFTHALGVPAEELQAGPGERSLDRLRAYVFATSARSGEIDSSIHFISATDESRESVEIARSILSFAQSGTPFDRMAVVLRNPDTYQPSVEDALRRAGIPACFSNGSRRPNPTGRALLALLACASEELSASRFSEYLSLGQVPAIHSRPPNWVPIQGELFALLPPTEEVPAAPDEQDAQDVDENTPIVSGSLRTPYQWERLLVDAAVIGGRERWVRRLDGLANEFRKRIDEARTEGESTAYLERQLDRLGTLRAFALPLIEFLDDLPERATWHEWLDSLEDLAGRALRKPEFVMAVLAELRPMGTLGPVSLDEVREVLNHRLTFLRTETPDRRYGKVFIATADELAGLSFDIVFLPGLAEDTFPRKAFEDPLLLDEARQHVSPWLRTQSSRSGRERLLLHVAASAAESILWISYPRMDLAQGRARNPSFYALDVLRAITGRVPTLNELQKRGSLQTQSQVGWPAPRDAQTAIDDAEYDLAIISGLVRMPRQDSTGRARYLVTSNANLGRSLRARAGRWRPKWTDGDGVVASEANVVDALAPHRTKARSYSATALQHFAVCPYKFALSAIHRIQPRDEKVAIERMDALTRGSLFHAAQFRLLSELRARKLLPIATDVTTLADLVFNEVAAKYREDLAPAIPRIWESQIEDVRWDFRGWLREMMQPANAAWTPRWFELSFGLPLSRDHDPDSSKEPVELGEGIRVRGAIDMVEEREGRLRITDHKTGRPLPRHPGITGGGEILQPTLYAQAAEALLGKPAESARLFYSTERGGYQSFEVPINELSRTTLASVLQFIDQAIAEGFLPAAPREGACTYCDYRLICGPYEETRIRRKSKDRLTNLNELRTLS